jgi:hypothetical protein
MSRTARLKIKREAAIDKLFACRDALFAKFTPLASLRRRLETLRHQ